MSKNIFYNNETNELIGDTEADEQLDLEIGDTFKIEGENVVRRVQRLEIDISTGDKKFFI